MISLALSIGFYAIGMYLGYLIWYKKPVEEVLPIIDGFKPAPELTEHDAYDAIVIGLDLMVNPRKLMDCSLVFYTTQGTLITKPDLVVITPKSWIDFFVERTINSSMAFSEAALVAPDGKIIKRVKSQTMYFNPDDGCKYTYRLNV